MKIRKMDNADYRAYCGLLREVHSLHAENRPDIFNTDFTLPRADEFADMLADENAVSLAAVSDDGEMVGMCLLEVRTPKAVHVHHRAFGWISDLCVRCDCRGQGIGTALYQEMKRQAREMGLARVELMVWAFNEQAVRFYERQGMRLRSRTMEEML